MKLLMAIMLLFIASPVFAMNDSIIGYCKTTVNPDRCLSDFQADERAFHRTQQEERQYQQQMDLMREQSRGMALFGAGNALINGMNQGFNNMHLPPAPPMYLPPPVPAR